MLGGGALDPLMAASDSDGAHSPCGCGVRLKRGGAWQGAMSYEAALEAANEGRRDARWADDALNRDQARAVGPQYLAPFPSTPYSRPPL